MKNNKRKLNYLLVIIILLLVSVGYAILSTNLNIVGSSQISAPTWDIHWENVVVKTGSVSATTPTIDTNKTTVNYTVTLTIPGEYYEFTVDAVNAGTIDGMVSVVSNKLNGTEITTLPNYLEYKVSYEDGVDIAPNHLLAANSSEKYKVHVGYKKDISVSDIPATPQTLNLSFSVTYVQSDSSVVPVPHPEPVYTVNIYDSSDVANTVVKLGQAIPAAITQYRTPQEAMAAYNNQTFYLKHRVEEDKVKESYVEFVITPELAQANPGMTAGTYSLRGGVDESELTEKTVFESNKESLLNAFGSSYCEEYVRAIYCEITDFGDGDYFGADATSDGYVEVYHGSHFDCRVGSDAQSRC